MLATTEICLQTMKFIGPFKELLLHPLLRVFLTKLAKQDCPRYHCFVQSFSSVFLFGGIQKKKIQFDKWIRYRYEPQLLHNSNYCIIQIIYRGKKSKSVFDFLTYAWEIWFAVFMRKLRNLSGWLSYLIKSIK